MWKISPKHDTSFLENPTIEKFIEVYEARINGWMLKQAEKLLGEPDADFAVMLILLPYFESYAIYRTGIINKGKTECLFVIGFISVFSNLLSVENGEAIAKIFYEDFRCGLAHIGLPKKRIAILSKDKPYMYQILRPSQTDKAERMAFPIDGKLLFDLIKKHFDNYVKDLKNTKNHEMRGNFEIAFRKLFMYKE